MQNIRIIATRLATVTAAIVLCATHAHAQTTAQQDPQAVRADSLFRAQSWTASADAYGRLATASPQRGGLWLRLAVSLQMAGQKDAAVDPYRKAIALKVGQVAMYNYGTLNALRGATDSAFYWLEQAVTNGFTNEAGLTSDNDLASLRQDARYATLVAHVHAAAEPCMSRPESHQFDFWIGEWDVTNSANQLAGHSSVQSLLGGCAILENWSPLGGGGGKSLNSYNAPLKSWQQFWTEQDGTVTEYREGEFVNGTMRLTAHVTQQGVPTLLRMTYTPIDKNGLRQHGEASSDGGKTWTTMYDFYYHRRTL